MQRCGPSLIVNCDWHVGTMFKTIFILVEWPVLPCSDTYAFADPENSVRGS